jgi:hypothetical protein
MANFRIKFHKFISLILSLSVLLSQTVGTLACLPNVSVQQSDGSSSSTTHIPQVLTADDLFIHCNNAVFSGSKIHARLMEAIVDGSLTIETLTDEFRSDSHSTAIGGSLAAISGMLMDVKPDRLYAPQPSSVPRSDGFMHPAFSAVPTMRIADEEAMSRKIREVAEMVGTERFYLTVGGLLHKKGATVGLRPDGVVVRDDAEKITAGRILEEKVREAESHRRSVINPSIAEFTAMMGQIDELQQVRARIAEQQMIDCIPQEERKRTDEAVQRTAQQEETKVKSVVEETVAVNDQLNQKLKSTVGEAEIAKLTSGKPVSAKTRASVAREISGAIGALQAKKDEVARSSSAGSGKFEQSITAASKETQLSVLNDRIGMYQQLLFALSQAPEPPTVTRVKEGAGVVLGIVADNCRAADSMTHEQYMDYQMSKMPDGVRSDPEIIDSVAASYFINKGLAKVAQGMGTVFGALDDATGNVFSRWMHKLSDGIDSAFDKVERRMISEGVPEAVAQNLADVGNISTQILAPGALGKAGAAMAGVTKLRGAMLGAVTKSIATVIDGSKIGMSWTGNWFKRGYAFEKFLESLFPGAKLPDRFKTFDFFKKATGEAISVKTLDTNTLARIARPETVRYTINGYINKMLNYTGDPRHLDLVRPEAIVSKELRLAVPANMSPEHARQIMHSIQHGIDNGVKVTITKIK